jgi:RimJ/RimL family protein N-acetyltransferase
MENQVGSGAVGGENASSTESADDAQIKFDISLGPLDSTDVPTIRKWRNDPRIYSWCRQNDFISDIEQNCWFQRQTDDPSIRMYAIRGTIGDRSINPQGIVGVAGLTSLRFGHSNAEFSLYIAPELQGLGFGKGALSLLLEHAFTHYPIEMIYGEVLAGNPALDMYQKLGFKLGGLRRRAYFKGGKFIDSIFVDILGEEWKANSSNILSGLQSEASLQDCSAPKSTES